MRNSIKKSLSIIIAVAMLTSLFVMPTSAEQVEVHDWEVLLDPVYEMDFTPDAEGKFWDSPVGTAGRQEVARLGNPERINLLGNIPNVDDKIFNTIGSKVYSTQATETKYSAFAKDGNNYVVKAVDAATNGAVTFKLDFPETYGKGSYDKYRFEMDWKWQKYNSFGEEEASGSITGAQIVNFYINGETLSLAAKTAGEATDYRGPGALYFLGSYFGLNASGQTTAEADKDKITKSAKAFTDAESGNWIHITVDFDFKYGSVYATLEGENEVRELTTTISDAKKVYFANGITGIGVYGTTRGERRINYTDNVKVSPISRPVTPLKNGEVLGENAYKMEFSPDEDGNFYDSPLGTKGRSVVPFVKGTEKIAKSSFSNWGGTNSTKISARFTSDTLYASYSGAGTGASGAEDDYCIKTVDNDTATSSPQIVKVDFPKTYGGTDDSLTNKYRVEMDWKLDSTDILSAGYLYYLYIGDSPATEKYIMLKTRSTKSYTVNGSESGAGSFYFEGESSGFGIKEGNQRVDGLYVAPFDASTKGSWIHVTTDLDFKNGTIDLTMELGDTIKKISTEITTASGKELFAKGIAAIGLAGLSRGTKGTSYFDNLSVTPIMTKEPTVKSVGNKLMWKAVTGATEYKVYASASAEGAKELVAATLDTESNPGYVVATLPFADDVAKYYTVTATSLNKGVSNYSRALLLAPQNVVSDVQFEVTDITDTIVTAKVSVDIDAAKGFSKNIRLITAVYDNNGLVGVSESAPKAFSKGTEDSIELTLSGLATSLTNDMYVKFYVWDDDIKPIVPSEKMTSAQWNGAVGNN